MDTKIGVRCTGINEDCIDKNILIVGFTVDVEEDQKVTDNRDFLLPINKEDVNNFIIGDYYNITFTHYEQISHSGNH